MHPATYYDTFMRYEASDQVFIAMPFSADFERAFDSVIAPAIRHVNVNGKPLVPRIVNRGTSGAPDIHEKIFEAIIHSRLVIADMTVQASYPGDHGATRWQPNSNVAYEVGLACVWRNPEDVLLIHQPHQSHTYSFDIQNLRHFEYDPMDPKCVPALAQEIIRAINQSTFIARSAYQKIIQSVSPSAIHFMHQEAKRAFPAISFKDKRMPIMDARIHAATELLNCRALKNRNVISRGTEMGVTVLYQWTELGLRMLSSLHAVTPERRSELAAQIASVPDGVWPPKHLLEFPEVVPAPKAAEPMIDMAEAMEVDTTEDPAS